MNLINWLRRPDRYWIWINIGQNQYEGPLMEVQVMLFPEVVDEYVAWQIDEFTEDDYEMVKVKTDLDELSRSFLSKFIYTPEVGGSCYRRGSLPDTGSYQTRVPSVQGR